MRTSPDCQIRLIGRHSLLHESLGFGGIGKDGSLDLTESSLATFQTAQFNLGCDTGSDTSLDPGDGDGNVFRVFLPCQNFRGSTTHVSVRGVNHDTVKFDALLGETDSQLELVGIGSVVQVDRDGDGSVVSAGLSAP